MNLETINKLIAKSSSFLLLLFFLLLFGCKEEDGNQQVKYTFLNKDYISDISHDNYRIPENFEEYKLYDSDSGNYTVTWKIDDGSVTKNCSCSYTVKEADSGAVCSESSTFIEDFFYTFVDCAEKNELEVNFGGGYVTFLTTSFECHCRRSGSKKGENTY